MTDGGWRVARVKDSWTSKRTCKGVIEPQTRLCWVAASRAAMTVSGAAMTYIFVHDGWGVERTMRKGGYVYLLASKRNGTLYCRVTSSLFRRVMEHKDGLGSQFTRRYGVTNLVWFEGHESITSAIQRETSIKRWPRKWKLDLIEKDNPDWHDLTSGLDAHDW